MKTDYIKFIQDTLKYELYYMMKNVEDKFTKYEVIRVTNLKFNESNIFKPLESKPIIIL